MVTNEHEPVGEAQWSEAGGQGDLGCLVNDAVIEFPLGEERMVNGKGGCSDDLR